MPVLKLSYKGFSHQLFLKNKSYCLQQEFEPGKTLYQILFEHLIDRKIVSLAALARQYKKVNIFIRDYAIWRIMANIESTLKTAPNKELRKMRFERMPWGGTRPLMLRKSVYASFSTKQKEVIAETLKGLYASGRTPCYEEIRVACLKALHFHGLAENVVIGHKAITRLKKALSLPLQP